MLEELRAAALIKKENVYSDPMSSDKDKEFIDQIIIFLRDGDNFNHFSKSTCLCVTFHLGFANYREVHDKVMEEVNTKYTLVDLDMIR